MKVCLALLVALLVSASASAQTAPCDLPTATSGSAVVNTPITIAVCHDSKDTNGTLIAITGWALYDGTVRTTPTLVADTVVSATGVRQYTLAMTAPTSASVHTYTMAAISSVGEGARSAPFVLTVLLAPTAPSAPTKLVIR